MSTYELEEQREWSRRRSIESAYWEHTHKVGIVDFAESHVWMTDGHWTDAAWSPVV